MDGGVSQEVTVGQEFQLQLQSSRLGVTHLKMLL